VDLKKGSAVVRYVSEYGMVMDTIRSFVGQYAVEDKDSIQANGQRSKGQEWIQNRCENKADELVIFFRPAPDKSASLMEILFGSEGDELIGEPIEAYINTLFTQQHIKDTMSEYYFVCKYEEITLEKVRQALDNSLVSDDLRYYLLSFYVNPDAYIALLQDQLRERYALVGSYHKQNQVTIRNLVKEVNEKVLAEVDQTIWKITSEYEELMFSICLVDDHKIERRGLGSGDDNEKGERVCFALGTHWKEKMLAVTKGDSVDILLFGKILSEPNRMKLIEYLIEYDEITIAKAVEYLAASVTATTYHLNMMYGAKMLKARFEGRKIFYSLRKEYFEIAVGLIRELADRV